MTISSEVIFVSLELFENVFNLLKVVSFNGLELLDRLEKINKLVNSSAEKIEFPKNLVC